MKDYLSTLYNLICSVEIDYNNKKIKDYSEGISEIINALIGYKTTESTLYLIGNGGSAAIASHMSIDFFKNGGIRTHSLLDSSVITCIGNDYGYEYIYSKQLEKFAKAGDLLIAISSSGMSKNIINGIDAAKNNGADIITFTGFNSDNTIRKMGIGNIYVPSSSYGMVESIHGMILQQIVDEIMEKDKVE